MVGKYKDFFLGLLVVCQIQVLHWDMLQPHQVTSSGEKAMKKHSRERRGSRVPSFSISLQPDWSKFNTKLHKDWLAEKDVLEIILLALSFIAFLSSCTGM